MLEYYFSQFGEVLDVDRHVNAEGNFSGVARVSFATESALESVTSKSEHTIGSTQLKIDMVPHRCGERKIQGQITPHIFSINALV